MCTDLSSNLIDGDFSNDSSSHQSTSEVLGLHTDDVSSEHDYFPDDRTESDADDETSWVLRMDPSKIAEPIALATPAVLGEFTPQSLVFSTLANGMPILNSLLGSPTSVFLDFDGDTTTGT